MKFKIHIDNVEHQVEAAADGTVVVDGETVPVQVSSPGGDRRAVQVGDTSFEIRTVEDCADTGIFVLELAGERIPLTVTDVARGGGGAGGIGAGAGAGVGAQAAATGATATATGGGAAPVPVPEEVKDGIWAPVPGKIVDVRVKVGDSVVEGDLVLILEAMKMENELHATKKATVTAVLIKKGDQAERGQLLVAFE
jgi:glutaconyl-CoA decarboxylase